MTDAAELDFDAAADAAEDGEALVIDLEGFEGPLHVLLALARTQRVDLLKLSITALADQYLAFIHAARRRRFALAADYLVMAAWLTFLKSRLLLPKPERARGGEPAAEDLAEALAFRLAKLDAMRQAVELLKSAPQTGRDVFVRGDPDAVMIASTTRLDVDLYALIQAYVQQRRRESNRRYRPAQRIEAYPLEEARTRLKSLMGELTAWTPLDGIAPHRRGEGPTQASYLASTLSAGLEMVKDGALEVRQLEAFAALYMRARRGAPDIAA
ncbi:MAG TPA: ScpA family protein [Caulobacteraceae bacterium]|jgi:segregation and condensation protein A|nr:ScpA family protein [Caulobacteraceae bacterium]